MRYINIMSIWKKYEITLKKEYKRACALDQPFLKKVPEINRRQQTQRNEDNCVKAMERWKVNFLRHHLNKYMVSKIRIKCHHQSTEYVPPLPVWCQMLYKRIQTRGLPPGRRQSDSNDTRTHAFINTHTGKKPVLRKDQAAEKEGKRSPEACVLMKASKTGPDSAHLPREGWTERSEDSLPCTCATWAPPGSLLWPCPALYSFGLRRQNPGISRFGPAGAECLTRGRLKALDHMRLQGCVWDSVVQAIPDDAREGRLTISIAITSSHFLQ